MTRKRNIGNVAAIGGATAMVALLTGLPGARADELADLRANQQLLQQRIDQLAQAQAQYHPPPPLSGGAGGGQALTLGNQPAPTAPSLGGSFPRSFLIPGTDTSIRVGGFVDITALDFLQGANSGNPGTPRPPTPAKTATWLGYRSAKPSSPARPMAASSRSRSTIRAATACSCSARSNRGSTSRPAPRRPGASRGRSSPSTGPAATVSAP